MIRLNLQITDLCVLRMTMEKRLLNRFFNGVSRIILRQVVLFCKSAFLNVLILRCVTLSFVKLCTYKSFSGRKEFMGLTMAFPIPTSTVCITV